MTVNNQRPGVYSAYTLSSSYGAPRSAKAAAVVAAGETAAGTLFSFTSYQSAVDALGTPGGNAALLECVRILFAGGVSRVLVSAVSGDGYPQALSLVQNEEGIGAVICDAKDKTALDALKASILRSCEDMRERVAFAGFGTAEQSLENAEYLNCERMVLCCPASSTAMHPEARALFSAAAMAAAALAENDPAHNWNGAALETLTDCARLPEEEIQALIAAGVTVLESRGGVRCVRPVTTRTSVNGVQDYSLRPLNAVLIIDEVISSVREALRARLAGTRISMAGIASQIIVELASKRDDGLIEDFEQPVVRASADDPSVCVAELAFKIAHVISQIHISAYIRL